jgi:hypothetical protein
MDHTEEIWFRQGYQLRVVCVVCSSKLDQNNEIEFPQGQSIVKCGQCHIGNTKYYPSAELLPELYSKHKGANTKSIESRDFDFQSILLVEKAKDLLAILDLKKMKKILRKSETGPIADFGAGNARYSIALKKSFPQAVIHAVDFQTSAPQMIQNDERIIYLEVEEFLKSEQKYQAILLRHVLEHSLDPLQMLQSLSRKLVKGGTINVEVPNTRSRIAKLTGNKWVGHYVPRHISHYDQSTLQKIGRMAGFAVDVKKKNPPIMGNQICAFRKNPEMSPLIQIVGAVLQPLQLLLEVGKSRGAAISAVFTKT